MLLGTSLFGLAGWQTMFLVEGLPAVLLGLVVLMVLPDRPATATWLNESERRCLETLVARDEPAPVSAPGRTPEPAGSGSSRAIYFGLVLGLYGFGFWAPQIIKSLGDLTNVQVGLISVDSVRPRRGRDGSLGTPLRRHRRARLACLRAGLPRRRRLSGERLRDRSVSEPRSRSASARSASTRRSPSSGRCPPRCCRVRPPRAASR